MSEEILLHKFISSQWALDALQEKRVKASTLEDLNDPFEFNNIRLTNPITRGLWRKLREGIFGTSGFICLSEGWSNPVIWSHYASDHTGLAIGIRCKVPDLNEHRLFKVRYTNKLIRVNKQTPNSAELQKALHVCAYTKFEHWQYENEWRFIERKMDLGQARSKDGQYLFFKPFSEDFQLDHVVIGANSNFSTDQIRDAAQDNELKTITARCAFKRFKVVEQKNPNLCK